MLHSVQITCARQVPLTGGPISSIACTPVSSLITPFRAKLAGRVPRFLLGLLLHAVVRKVPAQPASLGVAAAPV